MKKTILSLYMAILISSLIGCTKSKNNVIEPTPNAKEYISYIIDTINVAVIATNIKTYQQDTIKNWYNIGGYRYRLDVKWQGLK